MPDTPIYVEETFGHRLTRHVADLMRLAWPVMLSRAGILVMAFVDIAMLGRYGGGEVGVSNLGIAIFIPVLVFSIGLVSGMVPVVSQAYGAGNWRECGLAWHRAMRWCIAISIIGCVVVWYGEYWLSLPLFGLSPEMAQRGGVVCVALAPGLLAQAVFACCAFYLESTRRPMAALMAMVAANVLNAGLNWVMIFGNLGWPEQGAEGAAWASTIARFASAGILLWIILGQRDAIAAGVRGVTQGLWGPGGWQAGAMMRKLGMSAGLSNGFETIGFAAMTLMAGRLGAAALDAYAISHNLVSTLFMVGLGLAVATGVRVGQNIGAGQPREAAFAGWTGLLVAFVMMGVLGVVVFAMNTEIARVYTNDPALIARTAGLLLFAAFVFMPDSLQVVMGQALRAMGDAWVPLFGYVASFILLMIPLGWWITNRGGWDERGLVLTVALACVLATALLTARFWRLSRSLS
ncbi:MAG: MATE family efflux transporter [Pseudomonadota bacterium]